MIDLEKQVLIFALNNDQKVRVTELQRKLPFPPSRVVLAVYDLQTCGCLREGIEGYDEHLTGWRYLTVKGEEIARLCTLE